MSACRRIGLLACRVRGLGPLGWDFRGLSADIETKRVWGFLAVKEIENDLPMEGTASG